jgi:hypothetical protein
MKMKRYKSVNKDLSSKYDPKFKYKVGKTFEVEADTSKEECSTGLHCSGIIYANRYDWKKDQKIIEVEIEDKDIVFRGENKFRCKKLKVNKILTERQIDNQLEKEFTEKFGQKGLWNYCKEFKNKEFLTKKLTIQDKKKIKKLLLNTNKKLHKYNWNYKSNVRFIQVDLLRDSLRDSLCSSLLGPLGDSLWSSLLDSLGYSLLYSLGYSLRDSLWYSLMDSLWYSLLYSLGYSLGCKLSKEHDSDLLEDLIEVFRMGYLVAGKDKEGNWLVVASKDKKFKECII